MQDDHTPAKPAHLAPQAAPSSRLSDDEVLGYEAALPFLVGLGRALGPGEVAAPSLPG